MYTWQFVENIRDQFNSCLAQPGRASKFYGNFRPHWIKTKLLGNPAYKKTATANEAIA